MVKILAISDTHNKHRRISHDDIPRDIDILIHSGDISFKGELHILYDFNNWLGELDWIKHKIIVAGNHDVTFESEPEVTHKMITNGTYLQDDLVEIDGLRIYGSPYQPEYGNWAFQRPRGLPWLVNGWKFQKTSIF